MILTEVYITENGCYIIFMFQRKAQTGEILFWSYAMFPYYPIPRVLPFWSCAFILNHNGHKDLTFCPWAVLYVLMTYHWMALFMVLHAHADAHLQNWHSGYLPILPKFHYFFRLLLTRESRTMSLTWGIQPFVAMVEVIMDVAICI